MRRARLIETIRAGSVIDYVFDALGNRIAKIENGVRTDFAIDPTGIGTVIGEYQGAATVANYAQGLGVAARAAGGTTAFYQFDAIGNTSLISGANGAAVATYDYLPFGEISAQTGTLAQPLTFGGRLGVQDDAGDAYYMRARTYDASLGRFTTHDPIDLRGGDTNLYRFVHNDPINASDPTGLLPFGGTLPPGIPIPTRPVNLPIPSAPPPPPPPAPVPAPPPPPVAPVPPGPTGPPLTIPPNAPATVPGTNIPYPSRPGSIPTGPARNVIPTRSPSLGFRGVTAGEALGLGAIVFGLEAIAIDGGELLFESAFPNAGKTEVQDVLGMDISKLSQRSGASELFTDLYKVNKELGKSDEDATLDAIKFLRKNGIEDPLYNPTPKPSEVIRPGDPNNIVGPAGAGADPVPDIIAPGQVRFDGFVGASGAYGYRIEFENKPTASAPAQVVHVTQTLDADLDFSTFAFQSFAFGDISIPEPGGGNGTSFHTIYDATATLGVKVQIDAELNTQTGALDVTYTSLDPATNEVPTDPFLGFLPPDDGTGAGDGFLTYSVQPKTGLANATDFTSIASIVFDTEDALATPTVTNTLDIVAPTSTLAALPATTSRTTFAVHWTGADEMPGSGLAGISLYFTDNGGPLQTATVADAANGFRFDGEVGHTYAFFSAATDNAGNTEALAMTPDATISVVAPTLIPVNKKLSLSDSDGDKYTVKIKGPGTLNAVLLDSDGDGNGSLDQLFLTGGSSKTKVSVSVKGKGSVDIGDFNVEGDFGSFTAKKSDLVYNGVIATGSGRAIAVHDVLRPDALVADPLVRIAGGTAGDQIKINANAIADGFTIETVASIKSLTAASIGDGSVIAAALGKLTTKNGGIAADFDIAGSIGKITIQGGDLTGDLRAGGEIGPIIVKAKSGGGGGIDGSVITGTGLGAIQIANNIANALILAGADLGDDHALGGANDTFAPGTIKSLQVGGTVSASVFAAGLDPINSILHDGDDTILGGPASAFGKISIKGDADAASFFAAGSFKKTQIAGDKIDPATDPRFLVG